MKKFFLLFIVSCVTLTSFSQTLFTYGTQAVSKQEFLRAYNKNKTAVSDKKSALREYLDLYIKFKLKVKAALDMRLDTLAGINADLENFRSQIEESYLSDEKEVNALVQEAFTRSQKDIHIVDLFLPFEKSSDPADTAALFQAAGAAYQALAKGGSFESVAAELKGKSIPAVWADAGFITVFNLPYELENIIYKLKPGEVNPPYHANNGYHVIKNIEERKAAGKMKAAQILIAVPPGSGEEEKSKARITADSVYKALNAGADFSEMARAVSNDKMTFANGGIMPEFGTGRYDAAFESRAFSLEQDGQITPPFETSFGYHILKRLSKIPIPQDKNNSEFLSVLRQQVQQDSRISAAKEKLLKDVLKSLGFKKNPVLSESNVWRVTDSFMVNEKDLNAEKLKKTTLFSFNNSRIFVEDWLAYAKNFRTDASVYRGESYAEMMKKYISVTAFERYRQKLADYNPDFKYQIQEFKDGNMLFEIMERNVWSKASDDSAGLRAFYDGHKNKYIWNESADAILVSCSNANIAKDVAQEIKNGKSWRQVIEEKPGQVQTDSGRYELNQIPVRDKNMLSPGAVTDPVPNESDSTASFVKVIRLYPANQPRNFEESRGLVINDYQDLIEEKWVSQLKKKYPVKVNESVFQTLVN